MSARQIEVEVLRYDPEKDQEPRYQTYQVPLEREDWVVLDALTHIKDHLDGSLAFRWSCHMAVCGSCGMMVNNEPMLSCKAFMRDLPDKIRVEPLANFPIERDLVIVMDDFMAKLKSIKPYIIPEEKKSIEEGEYLQSPIELDNFRQYSMCINCMLCYAACPQYAIIPEFTGPAALTLAHRYNVDSRDAGSDERQKVVAMDEGVWGCTFVGACSQVCPKHVDPAAAIQQMKVSVATDYFLSFVSPRGAWKK